MAKPANPRWVTVSLGFVESRILLECLVSIRKAYVVLPAELDDATSAVWYSRRGCESAGMSKEDSDDWVESLHDVKRQNLDSIDRWIRALSRTEEDPCLMRVRVEEVPGFLTVLNDHRLLISARTGVTEDDMNIETIFDLQDLPQAKQRALIEMDLLGGVMQQVMKRAEL